MYNSIKVLLLFSLIFGVNVDVKSSTQNRRLALIKGFVQDESGKPIVGALVSIFNNTGSRLLKQVRTATDGTFVTRLSLGGYVIIAAADGFSSKRMETQINKPSEFLYSFKLERVGSGRTLIEKKFEKSNPKYVIRAATLTRSIYQNLENESATENLIEFPSSSDHRILLELFNQAGSKSVHLAAVQPLGRRIKLLLVGQDTRGLSSRIQTSLGYEASSKNQIKFSSSFTELELGRLVSNGSLTKGSLSRVSLKIENRLKPRDSAVLILGLDYDSLSKGLLSPRFAFEVNLSRGMKLRTSLSTLDEDSQARIAQIDEEEVSFQGPITIPIILAEDKRVFLNKSNRFETAIEKVLGDGANLELAFLVDSTEGQPLFEDIGFSQSTKSLRVFYSRKLSRFVTASAGYAFGKTITVKEANQKNQMPYQAFIGRIDARFRSGARLQAVLRVSQSRFFPIDPFQGKFEVYDPNLSFLLTQPLPNLGLPIRAEAVIDLRNIFDHQNSQESLKTAYNGRILRGGISVKF